ncbi:MAG: hypothetical protein ABH834_02525 [Candidatus Altiarchaeota archaeon]
MPRLVQPGSGAGQALKPLQVGSLQIDGVSVGFSYNGDEFDQAQGRVSGHAKSLTRVKHDSDAARFVADELIFALSPVESPSIDFDSRVSLHFRPRPLFRMQTAKGMTWATDENGGTLYDVDSRSRASAVKGASMRSGASDVLARFDLSSGECRIEGLGDWLPKGGLPGIGRRDYEDKLDFVGDAIASQLRDEFPIQDVVAAYKVYLGESAQAQDAMSLGDRFWQRAQGSTQRDGSAGAFGAVRARLSRYREVSGLVDVADAFMKAEEPVWAAVVREETGSSQPYSAGVVHPKDGGFIDASGSPVNYSSGVVVRLDPNGLETEIPCVKGSSAGKSGKSDMEITLPGDVDAVERRAAEIAGKILTPMFGANWRVREEKH